MRNPQAVLDAALMTNYVPSSGGDIGQEDPGTAVEKVTSLVAVFRPIRLEQKSEGFDWLGCVQFILTVVCIFGMVDAACIL